jgi:hypothetical protein
MTGRRQDRDAIGERETASMSCSTRRIVNSFLSSRSIVTMRADSFRPQPRHWLIEQEHARSRSQHAMASSSAMLAVLSADAGRFSRTFEPTPPGRAGGLAQFGLPRASPEANE